jgi:hypothetical protein
MDRMLSRCPHVVLLENRPEGFFEPIARSRNMQEFIQLTHDGEPAAYLALDYNLPAVAAHFEVLRWSKEILREMVAGWPIVLDHVRGNGCTQLVACNNNINDRRWPKMLAHFGFAPPQIVSVSTLLYDGPGSWTPYSMGDGNGQ